ncbi:AraC family transcriptional regulator [Mucilaginibacter sp. UR6-1]|uniref:helix-turn-helix domain-containing protein n=1 Tax=Mucilaginibacter sp. UR6-1 TaxID=1435643 RepID=UPI001E45D911|nr:AraC family transcriptional regulator [Mucilaginibacter sp. UR6-1]MCC8410646.1 AraC family transcriptional regulator [Mucilaginibacter sp. UR6-1]
MTNPTEIIPGVLFYSYYSSVRKDKVAFLEHTTLVMQVSGRFAMETATEKFSMETGQMLLIRRNQLGELTKTPLNGEQYQTIVICLKEDMLRQIALESNIETEKRYVGPPNILLPANDFLQAFFQSVLPYVRHSEERITDAVGMLKVKEVVLLLLHIMPELKNFLFDFSEPYKIDLEKFMLSNFHFNVPVEKFARLTGRSLAGFKRDFQKAFGMPPRHWLQEKRLMEARHLIEEKKRKPSAIYLDLGFESLSHFSHSFKKKFGKAPTA